MREGGGKKRIKIHYTHDVAFYSALFYFIFVFFCQAAPIIILLLLPIWTIFVAERE
jgi:hypothetical protein